MKMLLKKDTIDFPFIYLGHENENVMKKDTIQFPLIYVGHKNKDIVKRKIQYNFR